MLARRVWLVRGATDRRVKGVTSVGGGWGRVAFCVPHRDSPHTQAVRSVDAGYRKAYGFSRARGRVKTDQASFFAATQDGYVSSRSGSRGGDYWGAYTFEIHWNAGYLTLPADVPMRWCPDMYMDAYVDDWGVPSPYVGYLKARVTSIVGQTVNFTSVMDPSPTLNEPVTTSWTTLRAYSHVDSNVFQPHYFSTQGLLRSPSYVATLFDYDGPESGRRGHAAACARDTQNLYAGYTYPALGVNDTFLSGAWNARSLASGYLRPGVNYYVKSGGIWKNSRLVMDASARGVLLETWSYASGLNWSPEKKLLYSRFGHPNFVDLRVGRPFAGYGVGSYLKRGRGRIYISGGTDVDGNAVQPGTYDCDINWYPYTFDWYISPGIPGDDMVPLMPCYVITLNESIHSRPVRDLSIGFMLTQSLEFSNECVNAVVETTDAVSSHQIGRYWSYATATGSTTQWWIQWVPPGGLNQTNRASQVALTFSEGTGLVLEQASDNFPIDLIPEPQPQHQLPPVRQLNYLDMCRPYFSRESPHLIGSDSLTTTPCSIQRAVMCDAAGIRALGPVFKSYEHDYLDCVICGTSSPIMKGMVISRVDDYRLAIEWSAPPTSWPTDPQRFILCKRGWGHNINGSQYFAGAVSAKNLDGLPDVAYWNPVGVSAPQWYRSGLLTAPPSAPPSVVVADVTNVLAAVYDSGADRTSVYNVFVVPASKFGFDESAFTYSGTYYALRGNGLNVDGVSMGSSWTSYVCDPRMPRWASFSEVSPDIDLRGKLIAYVYGTATASGKVAVADISPDVFRVHPDKKKVAVELTPLTPPSLSSLQQVLAPEITVYVVEGKVTGLPPTWRFARGWRLQVGAQWHLITDEDGSLHRPLTNGAHLARLFYLPPAQRVTCWAPTMERTAFLLVASSAAFSVELTLTGLLVGTGGSISGAELSGTYVSTAASATWRSLPSGWRASVINLGDRLCKLGLNVQKPYGGGGWTGVGSAVLHFAEPEEPSAPARLPDDWQLKVVNGMAAGSTLSGTGRIVPGSFVRNQYM